MATLESANWSMRRVRRTLRDHDLPVSHPVYTPGVARVCGMTGCPFNVYTWDTNPFIHRLNIIEPKQLVK